LIKKKIIVLPVIYVAAGPGDPQLITLRGINAIKQAELVIADVNTMDIANAHANETADVVAAVDEDGVPMAPAVRARLAIDAAKEGAAVVRLCAGDPVVEDNLAVEVSTLAKSKIEFEYVPGVSPITAVPTHAGMSLFANKGKEVHILNGSEPIDWSLHLDPTIPIVVINAADKAPAIASALIARGRDATTSISVTRDGSTTDQRTIVSTLENIPVVAKAARQSGQGVIVIGDLVNNRDKYQWFENKSLFGWKVLVPRTKEDAEDFQKLLAVYGAVSVEVPTISVEPPRTPQQMERAVHGLVSGRFQWVVFTSTNAVRAVRDKFIDYGLDARAFAGLKVAAIGQPVIDALVEFGVKPDLFPANEHNSEGLLEVWPKFDQLLDPINRVFLPRADIATETLVEGMQAKGWEVEDIVAFRTVRAAPPPAHTREVIKSGGFDAVLFTSASTVRNLVGIAGKPHASTVVAVIGPQTAQAAQEHGLRVDVQAESPNVSILIDALAAHGETLRLAAIENGDNVWRPSKRRGSMRRKH
jgi:uroporphyrinogen III methyltransferase/synthase